jgi:hypothetical protein
MEKEIRAWSRNNLSLAWSEKEEGVDRERKILNSNLMCRKGGRLYGMVNLRHLLIVPLTLK